MKIITTATLSIFENGIVYLPREVAKSCGLEHMDKVEFKNDNGFKFRKAENLGGFPLQSKDKYGGLRGSIRKVLKAGLEPGTYEIESFGQWFRLVKV